MLRVCLCNCDCVLLWFALARHVAYFQIRFHVKFYADWVFDIILFFWVQWVYPNSNPNLRVPVVAGNGYSGLISGSRLYYPNFLLPELPDPVGSGNPNPRWVITRLSYALLWVLIVSLLSYILLLLVSWCVVSVVSLLSYIMSWPFLYPLVACTHGTHNLSLLKLDKAIWYCNNFSFLVLWRSVLNSHGGPLFVDSMWHSIC
jgi:hypothetical protein